MMVLQRNIFNLVFGINILLVFLLIFESNLVIAAWLQVIGRMHPLFLHFPITRVLVFIFWQLGNGGWHRQALISIRKQGRAVLYLKKTVMRKQENDGE